jgi:hypothetical protein
MKYVSLCLPMNDYIHEIVDIHKTSGDIMP